MTVPLQLVALMLMAIILFGNIHFVRGDIRPRGAQLQIGAYLKALKTYKSDTGEFPNATQGLQARVQNPGAARWRGPYLDKAISTDPWGGEYIYRCRPGKEPEIVSRGSEVRPDISNLTPAIPQDGSRSGRFLLLGMFLLSALTFSGPFFLPRFLRKRKA